MLSYLCQFNLKTNGSAGTDFLYKASSEWHRLYAELPGVRGTLLLANALGLAGAYTYLWRVDIDSFSTLSVIDKALNSDDKAWVAARNDWFKHRADVNARLMRLSSGAIDFCKAKCADEGLIHYVSSYDTSTLSSRSEITQRSVATDVSAVYAQTPDVIEAQQLDVVVQSQGAGRSESWVRLTSLDALESINNQERIHLVPTLGQSAFTSKLYGEIREVDGQFRIGA